MVVGLYVEVATTAPVPSLMLALPVWMSAAAISIERQGAPPFLKKRKAKPVSPKLV
jgi:hypothetical protein